MILFFKQTPQRSEKPPKAQLGKRKRGSGQASQRKKSAPPLVAPISAPSTLAIAGESDVEDDNTPHPESTMPVDPDLELDNPAEHVVSGVDPNRVDHDNQVVDEALEEASATAATDDHIILSESEKAMAETILPKVSTDTKLWSLRLTFVICCF
jgi:hypothetical protein